MEAGFVVNMVMEDNPTLCACGCGQVAKRGKYLAGHRTRNLLLELGEDGDDPVLNAVAADITKTVDAIHKHWELTRRQATHPHDKKGAAL